MKRTILLLLAILYCKLLLGQAITPQKCDYTLLFNQGTKAAKDSLFDKALLCFNSARRCDPSKGKDIDEAIQKVFKGIQKQKKTAEEQTKIAIEEKNKANKLARQSKSKELAANALFEFSKKENRDETVAVRLVYSALKIDSTKEALDIFNRVIFESNNQYYLKKFKAANIYGFNKDSSLFLLYLFDSTRLVDWNNNTLKKYQGRVLGFNKDSSHYLTCYNDSTRIIDSIGRIYKIVKGEAYGFNQDSSKFLVYSSDDDETRLIDWNENIYNKFDGYVTTFNQDSSLYTSYIDGSSTIEGKDGMIAQVEGLVVKTIINSNFFWTYSNYVDSTILNDWSGKEYKKLKGSS